MEIKEVHHQTESYPTAEYALAVTLLYFEVPLTGFDRDPSSPQKLIFLFEYTAEVNSLVQQYWNDKLQCSPRRWHGLSRDLKSRIKSELSFGRG